MANDSNNNNNSNDLATRASTKHRQVEDQAALVRKLKAEGTHDKSSVTAEVDILKSLKAELVALEAELHAQQARDGATRAEKKFDRTALEELLRKRFYYVQSFGIYGGVTGLYDYGPAGCALQANILDLWRKHFVLEEDMLEVDCSILTPHDVLKTSGHVDRFADLMCKDLATGEIFRVDHLVENELEGRVELWREAKTDGGKAAAAKKGKGKAAEMAAKWATMSDQEAGEYETILAQIDGFNADQLSDIIKKYEILSPNGNAVSQPEVFNLMFGTPIGPTGVLRGYLRPETAQGMFLNFKKLLEFNNDRMPFASAQIGRSFRNEISPRSGLLRVREFTMAEIEHFVHPDHKEHARFSEVKDIVLNLLPSSVQMEGKTKVVQTTIGEAVASGLVNNETLGYFLARVHLFLTRIGIKVEKLRFRQHLKNEMAHYACDCWDAEIQCSYGWIECVGCADRSAYDLTKHSEKTKERLVARRQLPSPQTITKTQPVIHKKHFGPAFKKEAKNVESYILGLDEKALVALDAAVGEKGKVEVKVDGVGYELTRELFGVETVTETVYVEEYTPNVIEPSFGIGRVLYCLLEHSWYVRDGDESRNVFSFPTIIAPVKALLVPISSNEQFTPHLNDLTRRFRKAGISSKVDDSGSSIGKRYARNDELGTPFAITVDFQTVQDGTVTLRERDSTKQIREKIEVVVQVLRDLVDESTTWSEVSARYPEFVEQTVN